MKIEAEGKELILQNTNGDTIIVPKTHREKVLKYIEEGNYKAIDDIAEGLPFMEDYADEGSLIVEGIDPGDGDKDKKKSSTSNTEKFIYTQDEYNKLVKDYYLNKDNKWTHYSKETGCIGSCSKNYKVLHPSTDVYTEYAKIPAYQKGITTKSAQGEHAIGTNPGADAWEIEDFVTYSKLGEPIVSSSDPKSLEKLYNTDIRDIPVGSYLFFGDAVEAGYVEKGAPNWRGVKGQKMPQHGGMTMGYVEDVDDEGNKVYNLMVDELGLKTIGPGKNATLPWKGYVSGRNMTGITKRYSASTDYWKATGKKKKEVVTYPKLDEVVKEIEDYKKSMLESIKYNEENPVDPNKPAYPKGSYAKAVKEGIPIPIEMQQKLMKAQAATDPRLAKLFPGDKQIIEE